MSGQEREALEAALEFIQTVERWKGSDPDEVHELIAQLEAAMSLYDTGTETVREALERVGRELKDAEVELKRVCIVANRQGASYRKIAAIVGIKLSRVSVLVTGDVIRPQAPDLLEMPFDTFPGLCDGEHAEKIPSEKEECDLRKKEDEPLKVVTPNREVVSA
jgi:hypothetical protein